MADWLASVFGTASPLQGMAPSAKSENPFAPNPQMAAFNQQQMQQAGQPQGFPHGQPLGGRLMPASPGIGGGQPSAGAQNPQMPQSQGPFGGSEITINVKPPSQKGSSASSPSAGAAQPGQQQPASPSPSYSGGTASQQMSAPSSSVSGQPQQPTAASMVTAPAQGQVGVNGQQGPRTEQPPSSGQQPQDPSPQGNPSTVPQGQPVGQQQPMPTPDESWSDGDLASWAQYALAAGMSAVVVYQTIAGIHARRQATTGGPRPLSGGPSTQQLRPQGGPTQRLAPPAGGTQRLSPQGGATQRLTPSGGATQRLAPPSTPVSHSNVPYTAAGQWNVRERPIVPRTDPSIPVEGPERWSRMGVSPQERKDIRRVTAPVPGTGKNPTKKLKSNTPPTGNNQGLVQSRNTGQGGTQRLSQPASGGKTQRLNGLPPQAAWMTQGTGAQARGQAQVNPPTAPVRLPPGLLNQVGQAVSRYGQSALNAVPLLDLGLNAGHYLNAAKDTARGVGRGVQGVTDWAFGDAAQAAHARENPFGPSVTSRLPLLNEQGRQMQGFATGSKPPSRAAAEKSQGDFNKAQRDRRAILAKRNKPKVAKK